MRWNREEYLSHMTLQGSPREMFTEIFGLMVGVDKAWKAQGATPDEISLKAFGWDYVPFTGTGVHMGARTGMKPRIISDTPEETISIDEMGRTMRLIKSSAIIPLPLDHPVKGPEDWERIRHWYEFDEDRIDMEYVRSLKKLQDQGVVILAGIPGGFDEPRQLLGEEGLCYAFYDEPEMIHDTHMNAPGATIRMQLSPIVPRRYFQPSSARPTRKQHSARWHTSAKSTSRTLQR